METLEKITIGEYVAKDFRTAALFSKYGIFLAPQERNYRGLSTNDLYRPFL